MSPSVSKVSLLKGIEYYVYKHQMLIEIFLRNETLFLPRLRGLRFFPLRLKMYENFFLLFQQFVKNYDEKMRVEKFPTLADRDEN